MRRIEPVFAALVATQAAHSLEEWRYRLYDVFPPARFVSSLVSSDRERGFVAINVALVAFGVWCAAVQAASCIERVHGRHRLVSPHRGATARVLTIEYNVRADSHG